MTDRHAGYLVTLDHDIREDDAQAIINAIRMIKHVTAVEPVIGDMGTMMAEARVRAELTTKIYEALKPPKRDVGF